MTKFRWRLLAVGVSLNLAMLPARSSGNLGLQLESRMVLMSGCVIWSGPAPDRSEQEGVRIVCSPDASSLAVNLNSSSTARPPEGVAASPVKFFAARYAAPPLSTDAAWTRQAAGFTNDFGIQLSGAGLFIPTPTSGWSLTRTADQACDSFPDMWRVTLSW